jgi:DNA-binding transcriptional LysR family regulator
MNLRGIDLNLLPVFEAIYVERSLTRASEALHISQPAVSNALARLRAALGDPLFVRAARGVAPTPAAEALIGPVRDALARLRSGLDQRARFDPATADRVFNISMGEVAAAAFAPALARVIAGEAPGVRFHIHQIERDRVAHELAAGGLDCAIDIGSIGRADLDAAPLPDGDRYVCALRRDHPAARGKLTLARFLKLEHVIVSSRRRGRTVLDIALAAHGEKVRPAMRLIHWGPGFEVVRQSDLALAAPAALARGYDVATRPLPFAMPGVGSTLYTARNARHEPANIWIRGLLTRLARPAP